MLFRQSFCYFLCRLVLTRILFLSLVFVRCKLCVGTGAALCICVKFIKLHMTPFFSKGKTVFREWELKYTENTTFSITSTYRKLKYNFQMNKAFNINPLRESQNLNTVYTYFCKTFGNCNSTGMNSKQTIFVIYKKKGIWKYLSKSMFKWYKRSTVCSCEYTDYYQTIIHWIAVDKFYY